jgi:outer membrane scaffolding protein for murein synthesis (MipA/OmpV family)
MRFGLELRGAFGDGLGITATVGATYADEDYMDAFFSVSPAQSAASPAGLAVFDAQAGIKDYYLGLSGDIPLGGPWALKVSGKYAKLTGDAASSPIVESEDQLSGTIGVTYQLGR